MVAKTRSLSKGERDFIRSVWRYYKANGRHNLPWRKTSDPYKIVVSELMLQQTQVVRVLPKYKEFLKQFPTVRRLAAAPLGDVLKAWQGLGYNRRAKFLWLTAQSVVGEHKGKFPTTFGGLKGLPGIGHYTAGAVMNFAYNEPYPLIETNVRTVYIQHFFHNKNVVADSELAPIIEQTLDRSNSREWNWALMDYGVHLKTTVGNASVQSKAYKKQSMFKGSDREIRGAVLRVLSIAPQTNSTLTKELKNIEKNRLQLQLETLLSEGLIVKNKSGYCLP